jgi:hypothetical protein
MDSGHPQPAHTRWPFPQTPAPVFRLKLELMGMLGPTLHLNMILDTDFNSLLGVIEIGSQTIDVQFDTTFNGVLVQSTHQETAESSGGYIYNSSKSNSWNSIFSSTIEDTYTQNFEDNAYAIAIAGTETFNIGGKLYSGIPFGQLERYYENNSGQATPFGGASGIIGLNHDSMQQPGLPSFMFAIQDQLIGKL